jgi:osmotically inducible lipoprotein OsmB
VRRFAVYALFLLTLAGCSPTGQGAMAGGLLGGLGGLAVGSVVDHPVAGTLIGGGLGAAGGALVGHAVSHHRR